MPLDVVASVTVIDSDVIDSVWNIKNDTIIYDDVTVNVDDINIIRSIRMKNSGIINGAVNICPGCDVYIENAGLINATFYAPDGASVVQMVQSVLTVNMKYCYLGRMGCRCLDCVIWQLAQTGLLYLILNYYWILFMRVRLA